MMQDFHKNAIMLEKVTVNNESAYTYILLKTDSCAIASFKIPLYSIRIEMMDSSEKFSYYELRCAFASEGQARKFFTKAVNSLVTPIDLPYVFEDELS